MHGQLSFFMHHHGKQDTRHKRFIVTQNQTTNQQQQNIANPKNSCFRKEIVLQVLCLEHCVGGNDSSRTTNRPREPNTVITQQTPDKMTIKNDQQVLHDEENQAQRIEAEILLVSETKYDQEEGTRNSGSASQQQQGQDHPKSPTQQEEAEIVVSPEAASSADIKQMALPRACYCPITNYTKIMGEPVVHPDGNSYEKSAIAEREPGVVCYPNRALKAYIEQELNRLGADSVDADLEEVSMRGTLKRLNDSARKGWEKILEKTPLPQEYYRPLPESWHCSISCELIFDPAVDPDGFTYERSALIAWLQVNGVSPNTRNPLRIDQLRDNKTLLALMLEITEGDSELVHPSLKQWREEFTSRPTRPPDPEIPATPQAQDGAESGQPDFPHPHYPTTQAELESLRRRRRPMKAFLTILVTLLACAMFLFFPSYFIFVLFCACALLWIRKTQIAEQQQMQDRHREHLRVQHQQQMQQQLHMAQQQQSQPQPGEIQAQDQPQPPYRPPYLTL